MVKRLEYSRMKQLAWFCLALACAAYWVRNIPVPEGYDNPWLFRYNVARLKVHRVFEAMREYIYDPADVLILARAAWIPSPLPEGILVRTEDMEFNGVKVRLYLPEGLESSQNPGVVYYHGGGWVLGSVDIFDAVCKLLAHRIQAVVASVEYRLAPEHPYPAGFNDCVTATTYFLQHAEQFAVDPDRVAVAGDSAGGNLAAAMTLHLRDINFQPQPKLQVLIYPCLQALDLNTPSYQANKHNGILTRRKMVLFWLLYATGQSKYYNELLANKHVTPQVKRKVAENQLEHGIILQDYSADDYIKPDLDLGDDKVWKDLQPILMDPYFSPLMAQDLGNLPEAIVFTAEQDVLRDDGIWYAKCMKNASVDVTHIHYKAGYHGILSTKFDPNQKNFNEAREMIHSLIKSKL